MAVCVLFFIFLTAPVEMRLLFFSPLLASSGTLCKTCVESMFIWGNYAPLLTISAFVCSCVSAVTYCTSRLRSCTDGCTPLLRTSCVIPSRGKWSLLLLLRVKVHKVSRRPSLSGPLSIALWDLTCCFALPSFLGSGLPYRQSLTLVKQCLVLFYSALFELAELVKWFRSVAALPNWNDTALSSSWLHFKSNLFSTVIL